MQWCFYSHCIKADSNRNLVRSRRHCILHGAFASALHFSSLSYGFFVYCHTNACIKFAIYGHSYFFNSIQPRPPSLYLSLSLLHLNPLSSFSFALSVTLQWCVMHPKIAAFDALLFECSTRLVSKSTCVVLHVINAKYDKP